MTPKWSRRSGWQFSRLYFGPKTGPTIGPNIGPKNGPSYTVLGTLFTTVGPFLIQ